MKWRFRRKLKTSSRADFFKSICTGQDHLDRILGGQWSGLLNMQRYSTLTQLRLGRIGQHIAPEITGTHVTEYQHALDIDARIKHLVALQNIKGDLFF